MLHAPARQTIPVCPTWVEKTPFAWEALWTHHLRFLQVGQFQYPGEFSACLALVEDNVDGDLSGKLFKLDVIFENVDFVDGIAGAGATGQ